jgi:hypothetical protein
MGKRLSQLNPIDLVNEEDYLLVDGEQYLESKKIKLKDIKLEDFNDENYYSKTQIDDDFVKKEQNKGLSTNDFSDEDKRKLSNTQEKLVSGVNVKTINNQSILGSGNITIESSEIEIDQTYNPESENAQSGEAVAEAIDNALSNMGNLFAPVIKQTVSGDVITVNDVSHIEHNLKVNVKSKNLLPYPYTAIFPITNNGITVTDNGDGTLGLNGTGNVMGSFSVEIGTLTLEAGTYYTGCEYSGNTNVPETYRPLLSCSGRDSQGNYVSLNMSGTTTITDVATFTIYLMIWPSDYDMNTTWYTYNNVTVKPYIAQSTVDTGWSPYIEDLSSISVSRYGSNLFNINTDKTLKSAAKIEVIDGVLKLTKTASSLYCCARLVLPVKAEELHGQTIYFQGRASRNTGLRICIGYSDLDASNYANKEEKYTQDFSMSIVVDGVANADKYLCLQLYIDTSQAGNAGDYIKYSDLRVSVGKSAYSPYIEPQTAKANTDGTVKGLISNSNMTLLVDNGVTLECEYNADTKMYIDNKFAELSAAILNS